MRIVSDGTTAGTQVFDASNNLIGKIQHLSLDFDCDTPFVTATLVIADIPVEIVLKDSEVNIVKKLIKVTETDGCFLCHNQNDEE